MSQTSISIRIDEDKKEAENLFNNLGMNMTTAVNIFIRQALNEREYLLKSKNLQTIFTTTQI